MARRLMHDRVTHAEEDEADALRRLHEHKGPECRSRLRRLRTAYGN